MGEHCSGTSADISCVNNGAFLHQVVDNDSVISDAREIPRIVVWAFHAHTLLPNSRKGRSEFLVCLRGSGATAIGTSFLLLLSL